MFKKMISLQIDFVINNFHFNLFRTWLRYKYFLQQQLNFILTR